MTVRFKRNLYAVLIVIAYCWIAIHLGGCMTSYDIIACHPEGGTCTEVHVKSFREFEQPVVRYRRDGSTSIEFDFGAATATTATSPVEEAVADVIRAAPSAILPVATPRSDGQ